MVLPFSLTRNGFGVAFLETAETDAERLGAGDSFPGPGFSVMLDRPLLELANEVIRAWLSSLVIVVGLGPDSQTVSPKPHGGLH
ncbi:hypothetical protein PG985_007229 [Apiospora marii]|uniref:Uncharacterized protein n=2 Tax=Apiospora TaxID=1811811 RepID=A0ABR1WJ73_9PEZI